MWRVAFILIASAIPISGAYRFVPGVARCSYSVIPSRADHGTAIVLARGQKATVYVGEETLPAVLQAEQPTVFSPRPVWAQEFRVEDLVGRGQPLVEELGPGFRAFLVPWGDDDISCLPGPWTGPRQWVDGDYLGVHLVVLRSRSKWIGGVPTFDVPYAGVQPYGWPGDTIPTDAAETYLTAPELFELNRLLTAAPDSATAVGVFATWASVNTEAARKYPASYMSQWTRR